MKIIDDIEIIDGVRTKEIPGYPDYRVSECGRVFSERTSKRKEIKGTINRDGYRHFSIYDTANKLRTNLGHRLVVIVWLPNFDPSLDVNHIDGNKLNNHVSNLEMVTKSKNQRSFRSRHSNNTSGFRCVRKIGNGPNPWFGQGANALGKIVYTKGFPTREQAAFARDILALGLGYTREALNYPKN